jgi:hypothetical protein
MFLQELMEVHRENTLLDRADLARKQNRIKELKIKTERLTAALIDPSNSEIADVIKEQLIEARPQSRELEDEIKSTPNTDEEMVDFVIFALEQLSDLKADWWNLSSTELEKCESLLFPAHILISRSGDVRTPELSPVIRYTSNKKAPNLSSDALLVELRGIAPRSVELLARALQV